jgi:hypothetical protein
MNIVIRPGKGRGGRAMHALPQIGFRYRSDTWRNGVLVAQRVAFNLLPLEGINHILNVVFGSEAKKPAWYLVPFEGNHNPNAADVMATWPATAVECVAYSEATRPEFVEAPSTTGLITNEASPGQFTLTLTKVLYGVAVVSAANKGSTTGVLVSEARFDLAKTVEPGDIELLTADVTLIST